MLQVIGFVRSVYVAVFFEPPELGCWEGQDSSGVGILSLS